MKAKRIVSILLTGSMLLSLLPVSLAIGTTVLTPVASWTLAFLPCSPPRSPRQKAH